MKRFPDGARVCFLGDSITNGHTYIAHIVAFYRKNFPNSHIEFYNCGISGANINTLLTSFSEYTAIYNPTHIVLMVGVNDSQRWILEQEKTQERYDKLQNAYQKYKTNLSTLCSLIKERNIELILCTPMPYAEYQKNSENPLLGGYSLIMGYADYVRNFAKEQKYDLCDYHPYITKILQEETLYNPDCVHPNEHGHYYMAKCFLNFQGFDLGEEQPIPEELKEWCEYEHDLQNIPTTEHFIIPNAFVKPTEERFNSIKEYLKTDHSSEVNGPWFTICAQKYIETKQKQQEYIHFVKEFFQKY